ncbi:MAG TPA: tRNA preQ1(34) S-adenosylmethionine ribosyltransferase-isomerase QueA [Sphaerochaeta sp.]|jgi:S-adenosylmethionine:tRNA ribosyltransferase-isomerase|nr:tRNA preQ1(34) S-adenosylmethionine ribosyltransferase-isomerase QueA [Spirochaetales bacterium]HPX28443.1 tRNA preQ1(34) S-adenosylmethionine ribosyltransferase-isomerase QueA [Sphaerochaeta sp.]HQB54237.1 tRNA preQ1(34) S-adenosylmethionine ribosyltransferase-isomerase QueA [Sphaerochaeta sp.]
MTIKDYSFDLPSELIAQRPSEVRGEDRLLVVDRANDSFHDDRISGFPDLLEEGSLLVLNDSKVRKARLYAESESGGIVEFLFLSENSDKTWNAFVTKSKRQRIGKRYRFQSYEAAIVAEQNDGSKVVSFSSPIDETFFDRLGHVPLPPYIKRSDDPSDETRYQTIYARREGSVAAPTAGLHFTEDHLQRINERGIEIASVTLHVGAGTFLPVRTERLEDHHMHTESYEIGEAVASKVMKAKREGRKIVAVGTTSVRTLESAYDEQTGMIKSGYGETDLFIRPGFRFHVVDQLLTNFHTPESTLLVLVSTFASKRLIDEAYRHAVSERYRFFSYGDAMFIR